MDRPCRKNDIGEARDAARERWRAVSRMWFGVLEWGVAATVTSASACSSWPTQDPDASDDGQSVDVAEVVLDALDDVGLDAVHERNGGSSTSRWGHAAELARTRSP